MAEILSKPSVTCFFCKIFLVTVKNKMKSMARIQMHLTDEITSAK